MLLRRLEGMSTPLHTQMQRTIAVWWSSLTGIEQQAEHPISADKEITSIGQSGTYETPPCLKWV